MRRITNGVESGKGFPEVKFKHGRIIQHTPWANLAHKAGLTLGEEEAKAKLKDTPITIFLNTKNQELKEQFTANKVSIWKCEKGWAYFGPTKGEGLLFMGDIESIKLD